MIFELTETQKNIVIGSIAPNIKLRDTTDNNWKDFKIFQSSNKKSLFLNNFFTQSFNNSNLNNQIKNKNIICDQLRSNISSINLSYFSKC